MASEAAVRELTQETGNKAIEALSLDLGSFADIRRFAQEIEARDLPLRALVCNAGLQMNPHAPGKHKPNRRRRSPSSRQLASARAGAWDSIHRR